MVALEYSSTNLSLIGNLFADPSNIECANRFLDKYRPIILGMVNQHRLKPDDAEDVLQDVLHKMLAGYKNFVREKPGAFRAWLRVIAFSATMDWFNDHPRLDMPTAVALGKSVVQSFTRDYEGDLMEVAMRKARLEFHPKTWSMFEMIRIEGLPTGDVAKRLAVSVLTVYGATYRVTGRLMELYRLYDEINQKYHQ